MQGSLALVLLVSLVALATFWPARWTIPLSSFTTKAKTDWRPGTRRRDVRFWHKADLPVAATNVCAQICCGAQEHTFAIKEGAEEPAAQ
jgi:hypothetical protein